MEFKKKINKLELIKYIVISILIILSIISSCCYNCISYFLRTFFVIILIIIAVFIYLKTNKGKQIFSFIKESRNEIRKVIWPTYQETLYTTLIIIIVAIITSLLLWCLDSILIRIIAFITNLRL